MAASSPARPEGLEKTYGEPVIYSSPESILRKRLLNNFRFLKASPFWELGNFRDFFLLLFPFNHSTKVAVVVLLLGVNEKPDDRKRVPLNSISTQEGKKNKVLLFGKFP